MNIAMFAWEALEGVPVGGGAVYASRLASGLAAAGHRVRLFTRMGRGQAVDELTASGVRVRRCAWDRKPGFVDEIESLNHSFVHYFADAVKIDGPYDIIHCHEWMTVGAGLRAVAMNPARLAVSFQSTEWGRTGSWPDKGDSARIAALEAEAVARAEVVVAASQWARRLIHEQFHPADWKCSVVRHGCDLPPADSGPEIVESIRRAAGINEGTPSLLFAGRFSAVGGGDVAARAARLVSGRFPEARFLFVGEGPMEREMRDEAGANALFISPQGRVIPDEYYRSVDLVLAPFRRDYTGRAALPAWAASRPVAVSDATVPAEIIAPGVNGWSLRPDPVELAATVMNAFADPENTAWMGRNGRTALETAFTWDESTRRLLDAYDMKNRLSPKAATV